MDSSKVISPARRNSREITNKAKTQRKAKLKNSMTENLSMRMQILTPTMSELALILKITNRGLKKILNKPSNNSILINNSPFQTINNKILIMKEYKKNPLCLAERYLIEVPSNKCSLRKECRNNISIALLKKMLSNKYRRRIKITKNNKKKQRINSKMNIQ